MHKNTRLDQGSEAEEVTNSASQIDIGTWDFEVWNNDSKKLIVGGQREKFEDRIHQKSGSLG